MTTIDWLHDLAALPLALLILAVTLLLSIAGLALVARPVRATSLHAQLDNSTIAGLLAALVGIYAIAAGLTAVAVWSNTTDAGTHVAKEATAISVLYNSLGGYPEPTRRETRALVAQYAHDVIEKEWPDHARGLEVPGGRNVLTELQRAIYAFEPATEGQKIIHAEAIRNYGRLIEARRGRIQSAEETALPGALWVVVTLLGLIAIGGAFLLRIDSFRQHALVTALVAAPIALVLFFIAVTDRPFRGGVTVSAHPYEDVIEQVMDPKAAAEAAPTPAARR
jgi:uncharacterized membrane protein